MKNKFIVRYFLAKIISLLKRLIIYIPNAKSRKRIDKKLKKLHNKIYPTLFAEEDFLLYVKKKKEGLEQDSHRIVTLALRGSTADYGFYSPLWKNSYNLGLTSSDLHACYNLYVNYRNDLSNLKNVIIYASVSIFGFSLMKTSECYRAVTYKHFFNIPYQEEHLINPKFEKWIKERCSNLSKIELEQDYNGYEKKTYYGTNIPTYERARTHLRENRRDPDQLSWLKNLNDLVQKDNRRLIVVIPPFRSDYKRLLPNESTLFKKLYKFEEIKILNLYNLDIINDDDFGDMDHLNEQGAKKLTNEIYQYFKNKNLL